MTFYLQSNAVRSIYSEPHTAAIKNGQLILKELQKWLDE